ncbi:MAG: septum formation protein Maf [Proteobacteria bacterium]|nr:septum formation protein Maf [Desulfobacula sp.]MBU3953539.1 septum formation protein Maf [Pseudomonadota bacterium]MBU4129210.1 septum formation protein Maf [Pseudomonadota bacterium]
MTHPKQTNNRRQEPIILASKSPRRKELLEQAGLVLEILASEIDETAIPLAGPKDYVQQLSQLKAEHIGKIRPDTWIIGADTIVVVDDAILGKPKSREESVQMLGTLNNRAHSVFTGFTIYCHARKLSITNAIETTVIFKHLSQNEINWYASTNEPYDKAGGYGIQGIGAFLVRKICGSYSNVVGLPVCEVMETLSSFDIVRF